MVKTSCRDLRSAPSMTGKSAAAGMASLGNRKNHQNSERDALPEKVAYCPRQLLTAERKSRGDASIECALRTVAWPIPRHAKTNPGHGTSATCGNVAAT